MPGRSSFTGKNNDEGKNGKERRVFVGKFLLGGSAVGLATTLPSSWTPPVVESVILPAHAQTSPGESLPDGTYEGAGGAGLVDKQSVSLLDSLIRPAHAANGARIIIMVCIESGEFDVLSLEVEDNDDSDEFYVICDDITGINGNGKVDGRGQEVGDGVGTSFGAVTISNSSPRARVSVDLVVNDVSIRGSFDATFAGKACKKVAKKGFCKVARKKKAKKMTSLRNRGERWVRQDGPVPRRSIRRTRKIVRDKPAYRVVRSRSGTTRVG